MVASMDGYALVTGAGIADSPLSLLRGSCSFCQPGSGIGRACALEFARQGAAGVLFADLDSAAAQAAANESRKVASNPTYRTLARAVDVTDEAQVESTVAGMVAEFGRISCVVNSAGVGPPFPPRVPSCTDTNMDISVPRLTD
jgi:NAD(P)-dependent dehydrogenase (short-subunit alcohol dehydrogenase family)